jgi:hypothetical protein
MATTTNYGWTTPNDTDLVKDGAAAIRTLGSSVDTTTKALNPSTTLGDIEYRSSTANTNTRLGIGTTGQVLTVASGVPSWATPAAGGGGKLLQVVYGTYSTSTTVSSTTYTDTGLSATITPTSATSTILIFVNQQGLTAAAGQPQIGMGLRLLKAATTIYTPDNTGGYGQAYVGGAGNTNFAVMMSFSYQDSPATTSATTYKVQGRVFATAGGGVAIFQESSASSSIVLMEIGA